MQRQLAQVVIALDEDVEGAELDLVVCLPERRASKSEMPSTPRMTALAIDDELFLPILQRGLDDPRDSALSSHSRRG